MKAFLKIHILFAALLIVLLTSENLFAQLTGTKTIGGTSPDYASFAAAVTALNTSGVGAGGVTFEFRDGTYNTNTNVTITATGTAANPIVFQSENLDASLVIIEGASSFADVVTLQGCSYVTFNELTIDYTGTSGYSALELKAGYNNDNVSVTNCVLDGSGANSTSYTYAVIYDYQSSSSYHNNNLTLTNNVLQNGSYGIYAYSSSSGHGTGVNIENNEFKNGYGGGIYLNYQDAVVITSNAIHTDQTGNSTYYGIYLSNCNGQHQVTKNYIYTENSGRIAYGINLSGSASTSGNNALIGNNSIQIQNTISTAVGIDQASSSKYYDIYDNTVYISGGSSSSSYCYRTYTSSDDTKLKNNIFMHDGTSTSSYLIYVGNTSGIGAIDYNCYYWSAASSSPYFRAYYGGVKTTFTGTGSYTAATGESNSVNIDPTLSFTSGVGWAATNISLIGAGTNLSTEDIDGKTRDTPTTIGAHELGAGTSPAIIVSTSSLTQFVTSVGTPSAVQTYTVEGTNLTADITITAPTNFQVQKQVGGTWGSSVTLTQSGGSVATTTIEARYNPGAAGSHSGNIIHTSTGATQKDVAVTGLSSSCSGTFSGTYTIDPGQAASCSNYQTFTDAISDLLSGTRTDGPYYFNGPGIDGAVTFEVANGTFTEQLSISEVAGASGINTITFKSATGTNTDVTLQFASSSTFSDPNYVVQLNGADYVHFEDMTIQRTGSNLYARVIDVSGDASNNTFDGNQLIGRTGSTGDYGAIIYSSDPNTGNTDNTISNNTIQDGYVGIYWEGSSGTLESGLTLSGNDLANYRYGMYLRYMESTVISGNTITNPASYNSASTEGIYAFHLDNDLTISKNTITLNRGTNVYGIELLSSVGSSSYVGDFSNNMISVGSSQSESSAGAGDGTGTTYGIYMNGTTYKDFNYNTFLSTSTNSTTGRAFYVNGPSNANINLKNNIFAQNGGGTALYNSITSAINSSDYNDFYYTGSNLGYWGGSVTDLNALQSTSSMDAHSLEADPLFTSNTDLHAGSGSSINGGGDPVSGITTDIDGDTRDGSTPDIGADEVGTVCTAPSISANPSDATICEAANTSFSVTATGTNISYQWQVDAGSGYGNVSGGVYSNETTATLNITGVTAGMDGYLYKCVVTGDCGSATSNPATLTVNPLPATPTVAAESGVTNAQFTANWNAAANAASYRLDVSTVSNFASFVSGYQDLNVGNVNTYNVTGLSASTNYYYRVRAVNSCGTGSNSGTEMVTTAGACVAGTWTAGNNTTDWFDAGNWSCGTLPTAVIDVVIPDKATTNNKSPQISGPSLATVKDLTIQSGGALDVTVLNSTSLTINGNFSNSGTASLGDGKVIFKGATISGTSTFGDLEINNGGTVTLSGTTNVAGVLSVITGSALQTNNNLTLLNGASLLHGTNTPGGGGSVSGNIKMKRTGTSNSGAYNFWSSPVQSGNLSTLGGNRYYYEPANATDLSTQGLRAGWVSASGTMTNGRGYISTGTGTATFNGTANNYPDASPLTIQVKKAGSNSNPWNLVGNPFPSAISVADFWTVNAGAGQITGVVYLWDDDNSGGSGWSTSDYVVYSGAGQVGPNSGTSFNGYIASGQSFFVEKTGSSGTTYNVEFRNSMRSGQNNAFFRQQPIERLWINVVNPNNQYNETLIAFMDDATDGRDIMYDAKKLKGSDQISIFSKLNGEDFAIQAFPSLDMDRVITLGMDIAVAGTHTLSLKTKEVLDETVLIILEDRDLGVFQNLNVNPTYVFNSQPGLDIQRFYLHFNPPMSISGRDESCAGNDGQILLEQQGVMKWNYILTNEQGQPVASGADFNGTLSVNGLTKGNYTLALSDNNGYQVNKTIHVDASIPVEASFEPNKEIVDVEEQVDFTGQTTGATQMEWDFGDGTLVSGVQHPSHTYALPGTYEVMFKAMNNDCDAVAYKTLTVLGATGIATNPDADDVKIYGFDQSIWVRFNFTEEATARVKIFNLIGQEKTNATVKTNGVYQVPVNSPEKVYLVRVTAKGKTYISKVILP